ncbi:MAG: hybrid sensor histidine kinase/response regulator [Jaaginema sp. PMC 1079.18]|nr:hybrid sensor histidine kinase/response regulator [Jaaginema sp. PMC 1080.18]MEC4849613.1 hybrid sensor histidine kinase/response regulator [Jaaginema sp. PMC 1079.18]MEC4866213.1 hybrid sensor histidine kinase/response regulator [Jaaginema sp. PMC 1078.18]
MSNYILAVDDTPDNLFLVQLALEQEGHEVVLVDNGRAALAQIAKSPPDLVVLDVMMPGMDGYEVTRRIRSNPNLSFIPILLITAHEQPSVVRGLDEGADEFIRKPVRIDELQARVRSLLRLKQSIDQRENFVHCLTHDLRTPLVAANRMLKLIQKGVFGETTNPMNESLETIYSSNENLLDLLNNLLEVYCYDVGQKHLSFIEFDLTELLEEIAAELTPLIDDKEVDLRLHWQQKAILRGDRLELRRVFTNLLGNALKFTDRGYVEIRLQTQKDELIVEVEDTGVGISDEELERIFERFRQGKNKRSGTGLGLHLCRQIIQAHHGSLSAQSQINQGTCFTIKLPRSPQMYNNLLESPTEASPE